MSDPFEREIALTLDEFTSPKARSRMLASFAREQIAKTKAENELAIGRTIRPPRVSVDGKPGASIGTVRPDGVVIAEFNIETNAVAWVIRELELGSPKLSGAYRSSHVVFADGVEVSPDKVPTGAAEYVIVSDLPYAKKLDPKDGLPARSKQAPKGVYAAVAAVAARRFDDEATVRFTFREVPLRKGGSARNPAIVIRPV
ncbi:hypothetical protein [Aureimonas sp. ME7]|uniref:hypothetical protein n=1 Tax=Aureimonas sp. ME7 TaxID=2744252 RepID=UPI0015F9E013|nr:hypothetical protein [Aureimonas sp. ME7]